MVCDTQAMTPSRPIAGLPRVIVPRLAAAETEGAQSGSAPAGHRPGAVLTLWARAEQTGPRAHKDASSRGAGVPQGQANWPGVPQGQNAYSPKGPHGQNEARGPSLGQNRTGARRGLEQGRRHSRRRAANWSIGGAPLPARAIEAWCMMTQGTRRVGRPRRSPALRVTRAK